MVLVSTLLHSMPFVAGVKGEAQLWGYNDGSTLKVVKSDKGQYLSRTISSI